MYNLNDDSQLKYTTPRKTWFILFLSALLLGSCFWWITSAYSRWLHKEVYHDASVELAANASSLTLSLERRLLLSDGLKAFVDTSLMDSQHRLDSNHFNSFAKSFIGPIQGIRNLSVYPGGIAKFVYPLKGNESVIGLDLFKHANPDIRENALRTQHLNVKTIFGPFELTQGGLGLLSRQSIFVQREFWGFVSIVLDVPPILEEAGLTKVNKGIDLAVKAGKNVIYGDPGLYERSPLLENVYLAEGSWEIAALPNKAKLNAIDTKVQIIQLIFLLALILLIYLIYIQLTQKHKLQVMVNERTNNLTRANQQLEATYEELIATEDELRTQYRLLEGTEQTLRQMAYRDTVTGLNNRIFFQERLEEIVLTAGSKNRRFALLFIDLDQFKLINDTLGHSYGDLLLKEVGERMTMLLTKGESFSRIGGDEFTIILPYLKDLAHLHHMAQQVVNLFQQPFVLQGMEYYVTASIGVTVFPEHSDDAELLMKYADAAMYRAKEEGKNNYRIYDDTLNADVQEKIYIKNSLRRALENKEFEIYYQPQLEIKTRKIIGLEALIRWNHPKRGQIPPSIFIPIAEECGLIEPIGEWVLRTVCAQSKVWQNAGAEPIRVAVNLSARQFNQRNKLTELIKSILAETGLDPAYLELEITENLAMQDENAAALQELRNLNITISIDDFGTHYSSLSYLKRLPIDKIKIDRSFVNGISKEPKDEAIILAIMLMASHLGLTIIAEGVETPDQLFFLQQNHCHDIQGFLYYPPQQADTILRILNSHSPDSLLTAEKK
ncbi:EAL domain-containing protein [Paenibacillus lignilyticus]|uniref:EAL domain-containing protein n=1 Tax=Paenibacillus lignilyticus TaxID=1172615 RepID=A0ABS5CGE5_9BACL|nr:EAL domain-containing protein [Paenibacillus lignilyticus]MBP3964950.1 EAL domain-containing protein [Paenibacillus lignilyticus]